MQPAPDDTYRRAYEAWRRDPEAWWSARAAAITWREPPVRVFDPARGPWGSWFPDAQLNMAENASTGTSPPGAAPRRP
jgi:propionyl-CoA synthetase